MEKLVRNIKNGIEAIAGRSILVVYRTWSALFIRKESFPPPYPPVRKQEIILIKRVNHTYSIADQKCFVR